MTKEDAKTCYYYNEITSNCDKLTNPFQAVQCVRLQPSKNPKYRSAFCPLWRTWRFNRKKTVQGASPLGSEGSPSQFPSQNGEGAGGGDLPCKE